jgi:hypothetical protein
MLLLFDIAQGHAFFAFGILRAFGWDESPIDSMNDKASSFLSVLPAIVTIGQIIVCWPHIYLAEQSLMLLRCIY